MWHISDSARSRLRSPQVYKYVDKICQVEHVPDLAHMSGSLPIKMAKHRYDGVGNDTDDDSVYRCWVILPLTTAAMIRMTWCVINRDGIPVFKSWRPSGRCSVQPTTTRRQPGSYPVTHSLTPSPLSLPGSLPPSPLSLSGSFPSSPFYLSGSLPPSPFYLSGSLPPSPVYLSGSLPPLSAFYLW